MFKNIISIEYNMNNIHDIFTGVIIENFEYICDNGWKFLKMHSNLSKQFFNELNLKKHHVMQNDQ